jgi:hypothetical protein
VAELHQRPWSAGFVAAAKRVPHRRDFSESGDALMCRPARDLTMRMIDVATAGLEDEIIEAVTRVTAGRDHIARQRWLLAKLRDGGHATALAASLLETFLDSQTLHEADAERLRDELVRWTESESEAR